MEEHKKEKLMIIIEDNIYLNNKLVKVKKILKRAEVEIINNINNLKDKDIKIDKNGDIKNEDTINNENLNKNNSDNSEGVDNNINEEKDIFVNEEKVPIKYKKLFRKIVLKTHPDKHPPNISETEKINLVNIYDNVINDFDNKEYHSVFKYAVILNVDFDLENFIEEIIILEDKNKSLEKEIKKMQTNMLWDYYMTEDETKKEEKLKYLVDRLKKYKL